jgi:hypothetical protein
VNAPVQPGRVGDRTSRIRWAPGTTADLFAVAGVVALVVAAAVVGWGLIADGVDIFLGWPPLLASWLPHVGPGTPVAVAVAAVVVLHGPSLATRLGWRPLLGAAYAASASWTISLALVDGWQRGVVERLSSDQEYLHDVPQVRDVGTLLATFSDHILTDQPVHWATHVGAHPPGVLLVYVGLDRIGLGSGGAAGVVTMLVGASACVAVAVALRAVGAEDVARRVLPFGVLLPGAVWVGVSADGLFAAVLAWGVALLAVASARRSALTAVAAGVVLGCALHLSYGLVLGGLIALAVIRDRASLVWSAIGVGAVFAAFALAGFWWFTGLELTRVIYSQSIAETRPYEYFLWANLAAVAFAVGPAVVAGIRRGFAAPTRLPGAALLLATAALAALLAADVSGLSKAEVERIWLPFAVWLVIPCALLGHRRAWLAAQAVLALGVNHLLLTVW